MHYVQHPPWLPSIQAAPEGVLPSLWPQQVDYHETGPPLQGLTPTDLSSSIIKSDGYLTITGPENDNNQQRMTTVDNTRASVGMGSFFPAPAFSWNKPPQEKAPGAIFYHPESFPITPIFSIQNPGLSSSSDIHTDKLLPAFHQHQLFQGGC
jgi:hypothetical protein